VFFSNKLEAKFFYDSTVLIELKTDSRVKIMSLSERKKRELRALAQGAGEALFALAEHTKSKQKARSARPQKILTTKKARTRT
jgi:hypothetical protein